MVTHTSFIRSSNYRLDWAHPKKTDQQYCQYYRLGGTPREREIKVVLETAEGEPWTMRRQRQATLGKRSKTWPKTEGDGGQFPWTYAPHAVKGNKQSNNRESKLW